MTPEQEAAAEMPDPRDAAIEALRAQVSVLKSAHGSNARVRRRMRRADKFDAEKGANALAIKCWQRQEKILVLSAALAKALEFVRDELEAREASYLTPDGPFDNEEDEHYVTDARDLRDLIQSALKGGVP